MEVGSDQARGLIMREHYAHRMPTIQRAFALMENGSMVGVVTFGQPASPSVKVSMMGAEWVGEIMELNRLVIVTRTKNAASFLVGGALRRLPKIPIVSYADPAFGHVGYIYQATNWNYAGVPERVRTDYMIPGRGHSRHGKTKIGDDQMIAVTRLPKHRYWLCRDKRLAAAVLWPRLPYPKGATTRHEPSGVGA